MKNILFCSKKPKITKKKASALLKEKKAMMSSYTSEQSILMVLKPYQKDRKWNLKWSRDKKVLKLPTFNFCNTEKAA